MSVDAALSHFAPATRAWFDESLGTPTPAQAEAWNAPPDRDLLVVAPTGSGKTLAAFLSAVDELLHRRDDRSGTSVLYVSPLKALAVDVERNLRAPLNGISRTATRDGHSVREVSVGIRSGDTPASERRRLAAHPPDILITTPESLFLLLTSAARESLRTVHTVIIDEIHAIADSKRGAHLALSLERLSALTERPPRRIGLSATVRPEHEVARFLSGERPVEIVSPPSPRHLELDVRVAVDDLTSMPDGTIWPSIEHQVLDLIEAHRSTLVFANSRGLAERLTSRLNEAWAERLGAARDPAAETRAPAQIIGGSGLTRGHADDEPVPVLARAHHGSVSKEQRALIEDDLKSGRLPCVVATSSLELGIDMGAIDLVIHIGSPPSVASGLQRVGRAGHQVGALSRGVIFPTSRSDLLSAAVTAQRMLSGDIEALTVPANPLDVLAQQTVAACALEDLNIDEWFESVRRSAPFASLSRRVFEAVLDLLSGRYPSEEFAELRPRILWDRITGTLSGRPGAQRLAVTSGGTIPDRGLFTVMLPADDASSDTGGGRTPPRRVGELDEEMVYETRLHDVISLGASSWRVQEITHDRVIVVPAPGLPARLPFWRGDAAARSAELGQAIGAEIRAREAGEPGTITVLDERAAANLDSYLAEQRVATGVVPHDRMLIVESFRDELGDWRIVLHSPFGRRVHAPWALAVAARIRERFDLDGAVVASDDGIVARLPDLDGQSAPALGELFRFDPDELERIVTREVSGSALFAARFRECAARALLLPRRTPGARSPLWQQRQRSAQLLQVAQGHDDFPILLETARECLQDVYDLPTLSTLMTQIADRHVAIVDVSCAQASPFAQNLVFGYVAAFLYEGDAPVAERRAAALSLDAGLLGELLGRVEIRDLLDPDVLAQLESELQRTANGFRATTVEQLADLIRRLGPLTQAEITQRCEPAAQHNQAPAAQHNQAPAAQWLTELHQARRLITATIAGTTMWAAIEDAGRLRDALGVVPPLGTPRAYLESPDDPLGDLVRRYARTHGPFVAEELAHRWGTGIAPIRSVLQRLSADDRLVAGQFSPRPVRGTSNTSPAGSEFAEPGFGSETEWIDAEILQRLRRRSLAAARHQVEPVDAAAFTRFALAWHEIGEGSHRRGETAVLSTIDQLAGAALPASAWESLVLPSRVGDYSPAMLDALLADGEVIWIGAGTLGRSDGLIRLVPSDVLEELVPPADAPQFGPVHRQLLDALEGGGAHRFTELHTHLDDPDGQAAEALWDLAWAGLVSNDSFAPVRSRGYTRSSRAAGGVAPTRRPRRLRARPVRPTAPPTLGGRWFAVPAGRADPTTTAVARAELLVERHGVLTRGAVTTEQIPGGFADVYRVLREAELGGTVVRGMFVDGLGAAQFATSGAIDRLRSFVRDPNDSPDAGHAAVVLAATDPAQLFGAALPWPEPVGSGASAEGPSGRHRPARRAGSVVIVHDGTPVAYVEKGARRILTFTTHPQHLLAAATALVATGREGHIGRLRIELIDDAPAATAPFGTALTEAGFGSHPKGLQLR